ncbi:MAG: L-seryl-tRNA(Sec) selenium transferase [Thermodesulfobacteriota bacterium]|nr:L-seryl-tRNA(Sec) selenium transferase [Thermodesulfobacteriota bacterium]
MEPEDRQRYLKDLPAVDELLRHPQIQSHLKIFSREWIIGSIRRTLDKKRQAILKSKDPQEAASVSLVSEELLAAVEEEISKASRPSLRRVINATGVVLHTNLGRAPLAAEVCKRLSEIAGGYSNLEFDLVSGERGSRYEHVEEILRQLSGAESAMVVNNNAGAVLLALNSLAEGKEVIVSRGQLVEIGGSFRIPDVMKKSGARLAEVGTTNRTRLEDYERAINQETALLLKVHTSNFRILGFTAEVSLKDLVALGRAKGLPVMEDLGSGCFVDLSQYGMEKEPTVQDAIEAGAGIITFSGDKLLGGPQAGIILGQEKYLDIIKKNPLTRALRIDKLTLAGLEYTLRLYFNKASAIEKIPVMRMLSCPAEKLKRRVMRLQRKLTGDLSHVCQVNLRKEISQVGGGALPLQGLPTQVIALRPLKISAATMEERLRKLNPAVIARVQEGEILLDLRAVAESEERELVEGLRQVLK